MSDPAPQPDRATDSADRTDLPGQSRSGTTFVIATGVFLAAFLILILVVSPRLQDRLGLTGDGTFEPPEQPVTVALTLDGAEVGTATWDAQGVCAEVTDTAGTTFRTCASPDPLRPVWAIDAPDDADPAYVIIASPQAVASVSGTTGDGASLDGLTQARELPAAWTLIPLRDGAQVAELIAFNTDASDLGNVVCGTEDSTTGGPDRLQGGCFVERQD